MVPIIISAALLAVASNNSGGCCSAFGLPRRRLPPRLQRPAPPIAEAVASSSSVIAVAPPRALLVPRVTLDEYVASPPSRYRDLPVIIRDIVPPDVVECLADELMSVLGDEVVTMQRKTRTRSAVVDGHPRSTATTTTGTTTTTTTTTYDATLADCVDYMMDSHHDDAYFAFCEGLLPNPPSVSSSPSSRPGRSHEEMCRKLREIREAPFAGGEDWFDRFPPGMRPTDAVILAGSGATSTLHRDPFEWTGTSFCLEGAKVWRFVMMPPPPPTTTAGGGDGGAGGASVVDGALASYRLDSIAWEEEEEEKEVVEEEEEDDDDDGDDDDGDDNREDDRSRRRRPGVGPVVVSAGWQSDYTLYDTIDDDFPSGYDWSIMEEEEGADARAREMEHAGSDASRMRPCPGALGALDRVMTMANSIGGGGDGRPSSPFATAVQRPGDLLLIPARCWHQTYAPVPSVAVSSQRCGAEADGANVIRHVVDCVAMNRSNDDDGEVKSGGKRKRGGGEAPDALKRDRYEEGEGEEVVRRLVEYVRRRR